MIYVYFSRSLRLVSNSILFFDFSSGLYTLSSGNDACILTDLWSDKYFKVKNLPVQRKLITFAYTLLTTTLFKLTMRIRNILTSALCMLASSMMAQRQVIDIKSWEFSKDKATWQNVQVPHDWAITGPFDKKWDLQVVAIVQNGEKNATEKSGRSGSLPWIGEGHYRTRVNVGNSIPESALLCFDGAMSEPRVYVNGKEAGYWAYGYNAFRLDVTKLLHSGENTIEVDLQNVEESSRWYPGAGLYRPVSLVMTPKTSIDPWATSIRTTGLREGVDNHGRTEKQATIDYETKLKGNYEDGKIACVVEILNDKGFMETGSHFDVTAEIGRASV